MFKKYGFLGIFLIIFAEFTMFLRIDPFYHWFVFTVWFGYILVVDAAVFMLKRRSLISSYPKRFVAMFLMSVGFWLIFEFYNLFLEGWSYSAVVEPQWLHFALAFSTILPAVMETADLVRQFHIFDHIDVYLHLKVRKNILIATTIIGIVFLTVPFFVKNDWMWALVWSGFIFLLEPINYIVMHNDNSLLMQLKRRKFHIIIGVFIAGNICGFLWEFWNFWANARWYYRIEVLESVKLFEMPILGYAAYGFFALELYVMFQFGRMLLNREFQINV